MTAGSNDVYVGGIGTTLASHVKFTGQATIVPGWTAGYVLQLEADNNDPLINSQHSYNNVFGGAQLTQHSRRRRPAVVLVHQER